MTLVLNVSKPLKFPETDEPPTVTAPPASRQRVLVKVKVGRKFCLRREPQLILGEGKPHYR